MNKILFLNGSPRKRGNTRILSDLLIDKLDKDKFDCETVFLYDYDIKPCADCRACKKGGFKCIMQDGMLELCEKIEDADFLIIGTPIYWLGPTAMTKLMLDRFRPYYSSKRLKNKKVALILPAGYGEGDCDLTVEMFARAFKYLEVELIGSIKAKGFDIGDVKDDNKALTAVNEFADRLNLV